MKDPTTYIIIIIIITIAFGVNQICLHLGLTDCNQDMTEYKKLYEQYEDINKDLLHEYFILYDHDQELMDIYANNIIEIDRLKNSLIDADNRILDLSEIYNNQIDADRIIIRPTYAEVLEFLAGDHTNLNTYRDDYDCTEFSNEMIANARDKGIFACATELNFLDERGHMIVAFNTIDRGIIYIEPQTDDIMTKDFSPGEIYWTNKVLKISSCWEVKT